MHDFVELLGCLSRANMPKMITNTYCRSDFDDMAVFCCYYKKYINIFSHAAANI